MNVFVGTSAFLAVLNADDAEHPAAAAAWTRLLSGDSRFHCTNYVLLETLALLQRRFGIEAVQAFTTDIIPLLQVTWVDSALHQAGFDALLSAFRRNLSLVDCVSFVAMRRLGLQCVFAFDVHFTEQGYEVVAGDAAVQ